MADDVSVLEARDPPDPRVDPFAAPGIVPPSDPTKAPKLWGRETILSGSIATAILVGMLFFLDRKIGLEVVWEEIKACHKGFALLGMMAHYATYGVRGARWRRTLRHLHGERGYAFFGLLVFFYNFVDNLVPGKLGDIYAAHLARINLGVRRSAALGSIVFLRMIDAWVVVALAAIGSWLAFAHTLPPSVLWVLIFGVVLAVVATLLLVLFTAFKKRVPARLPEALRARIEAFQAGMWPRPRELASIALMTAVIWALEMAWMYFLVLAFGVELTFVQLLAVTMIPLLASAFPLTPSGAGFVELSLYGVLRAVGATQSLAASITVLNRLIDFWLHIALGVVAWALRDVVGLRTWREKSSEAKPAATGTMETN